MRKYRLMGLGLCAAGLLGAGLWRIRQTGSHRPQDTAAATHAASDGRNLAADQAAALEKQVAANPDDLSARTKLLGHYFLKAFESPAAREARQRHVLWIIRNRPEAAIAGLPFATLDPLLDGEAYHSARELWLQQVERNRRNVAVLANAANFFLVHDRNRAEEFLKAAQEIEPRNSVWSERLGQLYALDVHGKSGEAQREAGTKSLEQLEQAAAGVGTDLERFYALPALAKAAFDAGNTERASKYATEMLSQAAAHKGDWNYGNAIHHGNLILGRIALGSGDVVAAKDYLLAAGRTPGSPQLNSFGPNMALGKELLEKGEHKVVLQYLELCEKFWENGREQLKNWSATIRGGGMPDFGANLYY